MPPLTKQNPRLPLALMGTQPVQLLKDEHETEVLDFLSARPLHTFVMSGFIRENGMTSPLNRGGFYACRNTGGGLEGVALIGHLTMFETKADAALAAFARLAQTYRYGHAVLGQCNTVGKFLSYYTGNGAEPRLLCRDLLFERKRAIDLDEPVSGLRLATLEELELIVPVHAQMAFEESGINPLERDAVGFRQRCARRIEREKVWISVENRRLEFKADIASNTGKVIYLEGVYVNPEHRGNGYGQRCVVQLTNMLLEQTESVCMLVNLENHAAQACYRKAGYTLREYYRTIYLQHFEQAQSSQTLEEQRL